MAKGKYKLISLRSGTVINRYGLEFRRQGPKGVVRRKDYTVTNPSRVRLNRVIRQYVASGKASLVLDQDGWGLYI